jgi:hypothetical protein
MIIHAVGVDAAELPEGAEEGLLVPQSSELARKTFESAVSGMTLDRR